MTPEPAVSKPTVAELGIDPAAQAWQRSGDGAGAIEIAFVATTAAANQASPAASAADQASPAASAPAPKDQWVLMRVADDPAHRVLVFDRHEWECFLDGARNGEFDDGTGPDPSIP